MSAQLALALRWPAHQRFAAFVAGENVAALRLAEAAAREPGAAWLYLAGVRGSGRTHLLVATCAAAAESGRRAQYVSLARLPPAAIRGLGGSEVLALDDLDAIAGDAEAEHAMFDLHNRCRAEAATLLFAAGAAPAALGLGLPDLVSRLAACTQLALKPLDEAARRDLLRSRARSRGLELDETVLDWLFVHARRDPASLFAMLDRIDREALAERRRVTIPFLRALFQRSGAAS